MAEPGAVERVQVRWRCADHRSPPELLGCAKYRRLHPAEASIVIGGRGERAELEDVLERCCVGVRMSFHSGPNRAPISRSENWPVRFGHKGHNYRLASISPVHKTIGIVSVDVVHVLDQF